MSAVNSRPEDRSPLVAIGRAAVPAPDQTRPLRLSAVRDPDGDTVPLPPLPAQRPYADDPRRAGNPGARVRYGDNFDSRVAL